MRCCRPPVRASQPGRKRRRRGRSGQGREGQDKTSQVRAHHGRRGGDGAEAQGLLELQGRQSVEALRILAAIHRLRTAGMLSERGMAARERGREVSGRAGTSLLPHAKCALTRSAVRLCSYMDSRAMRPWK